MTGFPVRTVPRRPRTDRATDTLTEVRGNPKPDADARPSASVLMQTPPTGARDGRHWLAAEERMRRRRADASPLPRSSSSDEGRAITAAPHCGGAQGHHQAEEQNEDREPGLRRIEDQAAQPARVEPQQPAEHQNRRESADQPVYRQQPRRRGRTSPRRTARSLADPATSAVDAVSLAVFLSLMTPPSFTFPLYGSPHQALKSTW